MDKEKQIEEIYEEIKYGTGSYSDDARSVAEILYNIGYRKQSEVAKEIFEVIEKLAYLLLNDEHYTVGDMLWDITELKKKYIEESGNGKTKN